MGKGDIKTKRGKRHIGSYGKHRPHKIRTSGVTPPPSQATTDTAKEAVKEAAKEPAKETKAPSKAAKAKDAKDSKKTKKTS